jgi:RHS repeat-associated protein
VWKAHRLIEEWDDLGSGRQLHRRYVYLDGILVAVQSSPRAGAPLITYVPVLNLNGSVCGYLSTMGESIETIQYSAYGIPVFLHEREPAAESVVGDTLLFHGAWFDAATGLYQMGERNLHPVIGRFLQPDRELFTQDLALFTAFGGDPVGRIDPFGMESEEGGVMATYEKLQGYRKLATKVGTSSESLLQAVHDSVLNKKDRSQVALGIALADFSGAAMKLAAGISGDEVDESAKRVGSSLSLVKGGFGVLQQIGQLAEEESALKTLEVQTWVRIKSNVPRFANLSPYGAWAGVASRDALEARFARNVRRVQITASEFSAREAYSALQSHRRKFLHDRLGHRLDIAEGLHGMATLAFGVVTEGEKGHGIELGKEGLDLVSQLIETGKAYHAARTSDDLALMFLTRQRFSSVIASKAGRSALSAAYHAGFGVANFVILAASDPEAAQKRREQVETWRKEGGWITTATGFVDALGLDPNGVLWNVNKYAVMDWGEVAASMLNTSKQTPRKREYYMNALDEP